MIDVLPRQLADVHQAIHTAAKIHEGTEVDDAGDHTGTNLALLQLLEEGGAHLGLGLLQPCPTGQDHVVAVFVELNDLGLDGLANVGLQIANTAHLDQGRWQEAAQPDVEDEATLDDLDDRAGDDAILFLDLLDRPPGTLVLSTLLRQDQAPLFVLFLQDEGFDSVTDRDNLGRIDVVFDGQLTRRDDPFGLVADVEQDLVPVNLDDDTFDDVSVVEILDRGVDRREQFFLRPNIVDGDLSGGLFGRSCSHVVGTPMVDMAWDRLRD